jgi:16S rRNA (uracil1498-N3)-methyltransferase
MAPSKPKIRLFVNAPYATGQSLVLDAGQSHYVSHVMRGHEGMPVMLFNGQDGQWLATITGLSKKAVTVTLQSQLQPYRASPDVWLAFAPIKNKTDLVVEKATELGVSHILPVYMRYSVVRSINHDKLRIHAIEAAEQCERHDVPAITEYKDLANLLGAWPQDRLLLHADETGSGEDLKTVLSGLSTVSCAVLIGPEGGFAAEERQMLSSTTFARPFGMGPRILRADTAAIAALACVQSWCGDWERKPAFETLE